MPFALFVVLTTTRKKIVFGDMPLSNSVSVTDDQLVDELTRAFLAYLGVTTSHRRSR